jgi:hypothetical protein
MSKSTGIFRAFSGTRALMVLAVLFLGAAPGLRAQNGDPGLFEGGWGTDEGVCPRSVGMFTTHNGEQFTGGGTLDRESFFWGRYNFVAHNQGGLGPIEMAGFFYISKAECYWQGGKGVFIIFSPVIEYYGPRRDLACGRGDTRLVSDEPEYDPYNPTGGDSSCGGSGGGGTGGGGGDNCHQEWVIVERSDDGGNTWYTIWEGWATVCE